MGAGMDPGRGKFLCDGEVGRIKKDRLSHVFRGRQPICFFSRERSMGRSARFPRFLGNGFVFHIIRMILIFISDCKE